MNANPCFIDLVETDLSRFDEIDVARCVSKLGGSMIGRTAVFADDRQLAAAMDVLSERFGSRYFARGGDLTKV